jgi:hypothetical protein
MQRCASSVVRCDHETMSPQNKALHGVRRSDPARVLVSASSFGAPMREEEPVGQVVLDRSDDGRTRLDVRLEGEMVWLSQRQLTELFGKAKATISEHIEHLLEDGELADEAVVRKFPNNWSRRQAR